MKHLFQLVFIFFIGSLSGLNACSKDKVLPPVEEESVDEIVEVPPPAEPEEEQLVSSEEELKAAIAQAEAGDIIVLQNKVWQNLNIIFKGTGTKEKPITLRAQTAGEVILSGNSSLRMSGEYLIVDGLHFKDGYSTLGHVIQFRNGSDVASYSRITNIVISGFNRPDLAPDATETWVSFFGIYNRADHSFFHDKISAGRIMTVWRSTDAVNHHQIDHNYFKDVPVLGRNGAEVIGVGASTTSLSDSYTTIEYNLLENCNGEGELIGLKSGRNIIRYNTIVRSQGSISLRHGNNNLVEGNFILGEQVRNTGGIRIMGEGHIIKNNYIQGLRGARPALTLMEGLVNSPLHGYLQIKNVMIEGNTLVDNEVSFVIGDLYSVEKEQTMPILNSTVKNNVIVGANESSNLIKVLDEPVNMIYDGNVVYLGTLMITDEPGIRKENPNLQIGVDGIRYYNADSPFKGNIVGQPLKKSEVGPTWMQ